MAQPELFLSSLQCAGSWLSWTRCSLTVLMRKQSGKNVSLQLNSDLRRYALVMDQMHEDKLDGKVDAEFWTRKTNDWREQERKLETDLSNLRAQVPAENALTVKRIFELANKAHFLHLTRNSTDRGQLLKSVLLNCDTDGASFAPTYRKPFDLIFERAKNEDWSGREDLYLRPPGPEL